MKMLILNGSPKPISDTMRMTRAFTRGLCESGVWEAEEISVIQKNIAPCRGCFGCWQRGDARCVQEDDLNGILLQIANADAVLWSFPLYCYAMPSHLKALVDRLLPLSCPTMTTAENGAVRHPRRGGNKTQRHLVVCGSGFPQWEDNFAALRIMCKNCFRDPLMICMPEAPMMNAPEAESVTRPRLEQFTDAGREYAKNGTLSPETIRQLEAPMIPKETYLAIVNGEIAPS